MMREPDSLQAPGGASEEKDRAREEAREALSLLVRVNAEAKQALAMLVEGRTEPGLELYDRCLQTSAGSLGVGRHLLLLEEAGEPETAERLRELALRRGGDIVSRGMTVQADPRETAAEYEALLERGLFNARMIESWLILLSRLGDFERVARLCDQERLLRTVRLASPDSGDGAELAARVQKLLLRSEAGADYRQADQSVRKQRKIRPLEKIADPLVPELLSRLREQAAIYLADWAAGDHPLARHVPGEFELETWALISRGEGYNVPHIHHRGWATGVYYPAGVEEASGGGELCVGPPKGAEDAPAGWPRAEVRPEAGLLVLMPSYYAHWTMPLGGPGLRTAIAFDIVQKS